MIKKNLPIGLSDFKELISGNCIYIDKTEIIYSFFNKAEKYFFLSRPRRFGKSLLVSTLKELFSGNKELFKHYWIYTSDFNWQQHPVINIDFSQFDCSSVSLLKAEIERKLVLLGSSHGIDLHEEPSLKSKLIRLVMELSKINKVVILIDEYDKPILDNILNLELAKNIRNELASFYETIKSLDAYLRAVFITGITKFAQTSLFSGLNNLKDLTLSPKANSLCGYTETELLTNFKEYLNSYSIEKIRSWYNGYRFSSDSLKVYNPVSVVSFLSEGKFENYWWRTGTPTFLVKLIKNTFQIDKELQDFYLNASSIGNFDIENLDLEMTLFQTGYLTIVDYNSETNTYKLGFPNLEVSESFTDFLMQIYLNSSESSIRHLINDSRNQLVNQDLDKFCQTIEMYFATIPYSLVQNKESFYHSLFQLMMALITRDAYSEVLTNKGRIDTIVNIKDIIYIFEIKLNKSPKEALDQILQKQYYQRFKLQNKKIILVGLNFNTKNTFKVEQVSQRLEKY